MASRRFAVWASPVAKIRGLCPPNPPGAQWRRPLGRAVRSRDGLTPLRGVGLAGRQDQGAVPPKPPRRTVAKAVGSCRAFERWPHAASRCGPRRSPRSGGCAPRTPQAHSGEGRWVVPCVREMASRRFAVWATPVAIKARAKEHPARRRSLRSPARGRRRLTQTSWTAAPRRPRAPRGRGRALPALPAQRTRGDPVREPCALPPASRAWRLARLACARCAPAASRRGSVAAAGPPFPHSPPFPPSPRKERAGTPCGNPGRGPRAGTLGGPPRPSPPSRGGGWLAPARAGRPMRRAKDARRGGPKRARP